MKSFKKPFIYVVKHYFAAMAILFAFTACSSDDDSSIYQEGDYNSEYISLINTLNDYSSEFSNTHPTSKSRWAGNDFGDL